MMKSTLLFALLAAVFIVSALAGISTNDISSQKVLVLFDNVSQKSKFSHFLNVLKGKGVDVVVKKASDAGELKQYGEYLYSTIFILAPNEELGAALTVNSLTEFVNSGRNLLVAGSTSITDTIRDFASEIGVNYDQDEKVVVDHFNYDTALDATLHQVIVAKNSGKIPVIVAKSDNVLYKGMGLSLDEDNALLLPVLTGYTTAYTKNLGEDEEDADEGADKQPFVAGSNAVLVAALQTKGTGRAIFSGSVDVFSDQFVNSAVNRFNPNGQASKVSKSDNGDFISQVTTWVTQESGVLRYRNLNHYKMSDDFSSVVDRNPTLYRVTDKLRFEVTVEEWKDGKWQPHIADHLQLEYVMLDPYVRTELKHEGNGLYSAQFVVPDVYGVFKFNVDYVRKGYTPLAISHQAPVRPLRLNEFERFIPAAFPYYTSVLSMLAAFFVFSLLFLYSKE